MKASIVVLALVLPSLLGYAFAAPSIVMSPVAFVADGVDGFEELGGPKGIATVTIGSSTYALVAAYDDDGVQIINITDPYDPDPVAAMTDGVGGFEHLENPRYVTTAAIGSSTYALVTGATSDGIQIIDITAPSSPAPVAHIDSTLGIALIDPRGVAILAVGSSTYALVGTGNAVQIIDITDPYNPSPAATVLDGIGIDALAGVRGITTTTIGSSTYALAAASHGDAVHIINVTDPSSPSPVATVHNSQDTRLDGANDVAAVTIDSSTYALVAAQLDDAIQIINITDPSSPAPIAFAQDGSNGFDHLDYPESVTIATFGSSTYALVASFIDGIQVINITDPSNPTPAGSVDTLDARFGNLSFPEDIVVTTVDSKTYALAAAYDGNGVLIIDVALTFGPLLTSASLEEGTGIVRIEFLNAVDVTPASMVDLSGLAIHDSGQSVTLTGATLKTVADSAVISIEMTGDQRRSVAALASPLLDISGSAVTDTSGNPIYPSLDNIITVNDTAAPEIVSATLNQVAGILEITFSDRVDVTPATNVYLGGMTVSDSGQSITLTGATLKTIADSAVISIEMTEDQRSSIAALASPLLGIDRYGIVDTDSNPIESTSGNAITISNANGIPAAASIERSSPAVEITSERSLVFEVTFSENVTGVDLADFVLSSNGAGTGSVTNLTGSGSVYYVTVSATQDGTYNLDVTQDSGIEDAAGNPLADTAPSPDQSFTVVSANTAPILNAIPDQTVDELSTLTFVAGATDGDIPADTLTYGLSGAPAGASINHATGAFSWTPAEDQDGVYTVTATVSDGRGGTDSQQVQITVNKVNTFQTVDAVPIVVNSTTADYFVLYVQHVLGADTTVYLPVLVALGENGTTTLAESVEALPKERYRVEKYPVADPADVDGDGIDDITELADPTGMNPVNPAAADDPSDGIVAIPDRDAFVAFSNDFAVGNLMTVKFLLLNPDAALPHIYFLNSTKYTSHSAFLDDAGITNKAHTGELIIGSITYDQKLAAPDGSLGVYFYNLFLFTDNTPFNLADRTYTLLAASMPLLEDNLALHVSNHAIPLFQSDLPLYNESRVNLVFDDDILPETDFLALNPGEGYGMLQVMEPDERPNVRDVAIYEALPNELPRVAGIISTVPQTPLSHINLRAVQNGVPNAFIRDALEDAGIDDLIGSYVHYNVTEDGWDLRAATRAEVDAHYSHSRPAEEQVPQQDLSVTSITPLGDVGFEDWTAFGVKAANVAVLGKMGFPNGTVPDGFAVPFYFYDEFMKANGLYTRIESMLANTTFQTDFDTQEDELKKLRKAIKGAETPAWITAELEEMHGEFPNGTSLRYRSSTNNEDLPGFNGAGLYDSKTQHPEETEEDGISKSLKQVYASLWNFRAFTERDFHRINHTAAAMGVLVHPNYSDELANGVAVSFDPVRDSDGNYYVNTQIGEDLVTNPDAHSIPEEILLNRYADQYTVLATSNQAPPGQLLMSDDQLYQLRRHLAAIREGFADLYGIGPGEQFAMEIEFKITGEDVLAVKQARPWIFSFERSQVIDDAPPTFSFATYSSGTGVLAITFSEDISGTADLAKLHVRESGQPSGGTALTGATQTTVGSALIMTLTDSQRTTVNAMAAPKLDIGAGAVSDGIDHILAIRDQTITVVNSAPTVDADSDQTAREGDTVTLNGTATDTDGDPLTYSWSHDSALAIQLANSTSPSTTLTAPAVDADTEITFTLTADDGTATAEDSLVVTVTDVPAVNSPPVADAGPDQVVREGQAVTLNGTATDDDGDDLTYAWSHDSALAIQLANSTSPSTTLTAPAVDADTEITFTLTADDGTATAEDSLVVTVTDVPAVNSPPVADAGPDQVVREGQAVTLNGTATDDDGDDLTYAWSHDSALAIQLANSTSPSTTLTAQAVDADTEITFTLTADDGTATAEDSLVVTVTDVPAVNSPPVADAGPDQVVREGQAVTLNGTATDDDGDDLTYAWSHDSTLEVAFNASMPAATFVAPLVDADTTVAFTLAVSDGSANSTDTVLVTVSDVPGDLDFVTTWETTAPGESITIPARGKYTIDWGDGTVDANVRHSQTHEYDTPGNHTVRISKGITVINLNNHADAPKLQSVDQWGEAKWRSMQSSFKGASNMVLHATDAPNLARTDDMSYMFMHAGSFDGDLSGWDVSGVTAMTGMFYNANSFNGSLSGWDVSGVTDMTGMFYNVHSFNGDLSGWDVSGVTDMTGMFYNVHSFNGNLSGWDVSGVTDMSSMFSGASSFDGNISAWDVSSVTDMNGMFATANSFNGNISGWDVSGATDMTRMFHNADSFEQNLGPWYIVLDDVVIDSDSIPGEVGRIAAQNSFLDGQNPAYGIGSGGDSAHFELDGDILKMTSVPDGHEGPYSVTITSTKGFGTGNSRAFDIEISGFTDNAPPSVDAGQNQTADEGDTVTLSGTASDSNNDPLTYSWSHDSALAIQLANSTSPSTTFTAPAVDVDTEITFTLTADDGTATAEDLLVVTVTDVPAVNSPPVADAGSDQTVDEGDTVTLSGTASDADSDPLTHMWTHDQPGLDISLANDTALLTTFTAPEVTADTTVMFTLTVGDGENTVTDAVIVTINHNDAPSVDAGADQTVEEGDTVTLSGTATDADADQLTYAWTHDYDLILSLSDDAALSTTFTAPAVADDTTITFTLTVSDGINTAVSDSVTLTVEDVPDTSLPAGAFVTTWQTTSANERITIPIGATTGTYSIDWGDGHVSENVSSLQQHRYADSGTYTVSIMGDFTRIMLYSDLDNAKKMQSIEQWGNTRWTSMNSAFSGASNMVYRATDTPDLSDVTTTSHMFDGIFSFNGNLSDWDVSGVTSMSGMFSNAHSFDGDISDWDVSGVTSMSGMFSNAHSFDGDISGWDVSGVTDMTTMFLNAHSFDGDISGWDVSGVTDMTTMFLNAGSFNADISDWDVSGVTSMSNMFRDAGSFNADISDWDVSGVENMRAMLSNTDSFDRNLGKWYITLDGTAVDGDIWAAGTISAQNSFLDDQSPVYGIGTGGDSNLFEINGSVLRLKGTPDRSAGSTYTVTVTSTGDFGASNSRTLEATVAANPSDIPAESERGPREIGEVSLNSTVPGTVYVSWEPPSEQPLEYRITWAKSGENFPDWRDPVGNAFPAGSSHTITGLDEGEEYQIKVRARYDSSRPGDWSGEFTVTVARTG